MKVLIIAVVSKLIEKKEINSENISLNFFDRGVNYNLQEMGQCQNSQLAPKSYLSKL